MADGIEISLAIERETVDAGIDHSLLVLPDSLQLDEVPASVPSGFTAKAKTYSERLSTT